MKPVLRPALPVRNADEALVWLTEEYFDEWELRYARQQADPAKWLTSEARHSARGQCDGRLWLETRRGYVCMWINGDDPLRSPKPDVEITIERVVRLALGENVLQLSLFTEPACP
ncbi:MAG: hypothetical protein M1546_00385 [Chloroflexi bacterium]|nr:hypothetical protein [Chloroflexota bacterium]